MRVMFLRGYHSLRPIRSPFPCHGGIAGSDRPKHRSENSRARAGTWAWKCSETAAVALGEGNVSSYAGLEPGSEMKNVAQENTPAASWHTISAETACERLQASERGLSSEEAQRRLSRYGPNQLAQARQRSALRRFFAQFNNMLLYVLLAASAVMALLGHYTDASVIFAVTVLNAFIGFIQEGKAEKALGAIRQMLSSNASVLRDGRRVSIPAADLVPG